MAYKNKEDKLNWQRNARRLNREKYREYRKKAYQRHKKKELADTKKWKEENKEKVKAYMRDYNKKYYPKNKRKFYVRSYLRVYLIQLLIEKHGGCQKCGSLDNLEIHHKKYTRDIDDVMLVCKSCHNKITRKAKNQK